ncbi:MAG: nitroreductase family protein [Deltaproteobacteria bacterium]|nr:nitroreductase family protein [Deltaproteobacteria bacterium]
MPNQLDMIKGRRSIRRYEEKDIPEQDLQQVLESIQWSPSWANTQCWEVVVIKNPGQKEKLQATLNDTNPAKKAVIQSPVVLALCGKTKSAGYYKSQASTKFGDWLMFDLGIAAQSICLTAHDLGLGTVIVGMFDQDKAKGILGVGHEYELVALIPMGYPAKEASAPKRREIGEFTHYNQFNVRK